MLLLLLAAAAVAVSCQPTPIDEEDEQATRLNRQRQLLLAQECHYEKRITEIEAGMLATRQQLAEAQALLQTAQSLLASKQAEEAASHENGCWCTAGSIPAFVGGRCHCWTPMPIVSTMVVIEVATIPIEFSGPWNPLTITADVTFERHSRFVVIAQFPDIAGPQGEGAVDKIIATIPSGWCPPSIVSFVVNVYHGYDTDTKGQLSIDENCTLELALAPNLGAFTEPGTSGLVATDLTWTLPLN